jgi:hypothetical protein
MTPTPKLRRLLAAALLSAAAGWSTAAAAHDFFLLPSAFSAKAGESVALSATVSAAFPKLESAVPRERIGATAGAGAARAGPLQIVADGKLQMSAAAPGVAIAAAAAAPRDLQYAGETIGVILEEYDIEGAAAATVKALPRPQTLQVVSRRFAKAFVCVAGCADRKAATAPVGHPLEFVAAEPGLSRFTLLSNGKPLPDHPVAVGHTGGRERLRTDREGQVQLPSLTGPVMLFAAEMSPPASPTGRFDLKLASLTVGR